MADLVMGAMGSLVPKLYELLKEEYNLQTGVKEHISFLTEELELAQATLCKVAEVPWDQLDKQVQIWSRKVREASYDMEDVLDTFLVRVKGPDSTEDKQSLQKYLKKVAKFFKKSKARRKISGDVKDIMSHLQKVTEQCSRYKVDDIAAKPATPSTVDPRLHAMYTHVNKLVGMDKSSGELMSMLQSNIQHSDMSSTKMKIVSIVGVGGLGKTTLAKVVYDKIRGDFNYRAFVSVGRNPDLQKVLQMILIALDEERYEKFNFAVLQDITQFIDKLREFLQQNKRYIIVVDDLWEERSWEILRLAIAGDKSCECAIIITTRNQEVAEKSDEIYKLRPLPDDISRELFYTRIGGDDGKLVDNKPDEVTVKFLKKCAGVPLAIITMASLLAGKPREKWDVLYRSIGFRSEDNDQAQDTMRIVSFSYYDLPAHLRTCLLYLSAFPEDFVIPKVSLVWMWVAEGFVKKKQGMRLFEIGEGYFHDLTNRSMLEAVNSDEDDSIVTGCRVHDMVLDFIRSMSHQENFFSVALGNDQGTLQERNNVPHRLAHLNRTMGHGRGLGDDLKMEKVRSLFAIRCAIEASDPFHGFTLLRVLVIDNCKATIDFRNEHVRHLLHLRLLSIGGASVERIPEEIGRLRFLQTLDLNESSLKECPSLGSLPEQLLRLCLPKLTINCSNEGIVSLEKLTCLEELSICVSGLVSWRLPTELRVLQVEIMVGAEATERDFWECVSHLNKLEHLKARGKFSEATVSVLSSSVRHLVVRGHIRPSSRLPSCVNASCLPNLSHLELVLGHLDEHDLKMLGMLPELRFLSLYLWARAKVSTVVVVSDKDAAEVYFPRLRCFELVNPMVSCYANEEDKSISFHLWVGGPHTYLTKPSVSVHKSQGATISCSTGGGRANTSTTGGGAPCNRFMPSLQVLRFEQWGDVNWDYPCSDNLGLEYGFPSLREIRVRIFGREITGALRSSAEKHPNRPAFRKLGMW